MEDHHWKDFCSSFGDHCSGSGEPLHAEGREIKSVFFRKTILAAGGGRERGEGERRLARKLWNRLREVVVARAKTRALVIDLKTHLTV